MPNSGSSRIALACGVRTFATAILNSCIISSVTCSCGTPLAFAMDLRRLPLWSIAAAAMTPLSFESAFMCFTLPSESCIRFFSRCCARLLPGDRTLSVYRRDAIANPAPIRLRAANISEDLAAQIVNGREPGFPAQEGAKLYPDALRGQAVEL